MADVIDITTSDAALAEGAAAGSATAFEALYRRHAPAAWRVAQAVTGNADDAADAVSEAFTKVFQALPSGRLQEGGQFRPYLLTAVRNAGIDVLRRSGRVRPAEGSELDRPAGASGPSELVIDAADGALVARAFKSLPERWRSVLWLTEVEGMPAKEAADLLGVSPNGVAQLAVRARAGLRERFLQAHLAAAEVDKVCRYTVDHLGAYVAGGLAPRDIAKVDQHLAGCPACKAREEELADLGSTLRRVAIPLPLALLTMSSAKWHLTAHSFLGSHAARATVRFGKAGEWAGKAQRPMALLSAGLLAVGIAGVSVVHPDSHGPSAAASPASPTRLHKPVEADRAPAGTTPTASATSAGGALSAHRRVLRAAAGTTTTTTTTTVPALDATPGTPPAAIVTDGSIGAPAAPASPTPVAQINFEFNLGPISATLSLGAGDGSCTGLVIDTTVTDPQAIGTCTAPSGAVSTDGHSVTIDTSGTLLPPEHLTIG